VAAYNVGLLLAEQGDVQGAKDAFQKAIDSGHADIAPRATVSLRALLTLMGQENLQGALEEL
jgi:hypothetical protein